VSDRDRLRTTFGEDAELYDRMRPQYPSALFDDLATLAWLRAGAPVLEIGPGTGQATIALARRGYRVTAVELSEDLARLCQMRCASSDVRVDVGAFEDWPLTQQFDLVFAATAFHWIDPAVRLRKSAQALRPGGALATVRTEHIAGGTDAFFAAAQRCYERWDALTPPGLRLEPAEAIPFEADDHIAGSELFEAPIFRRYEWEQTYTIAEYRNLLLTYSGHRALPREQQQGLLECITECAAGKPVTKRYLFELRVARVKNDRSHS
jgi:SAM-dependent methyltransferase